jgi:hypothetical protein
MQNVTAIMRLPVPVGAAAASGLVAFVAGATLALGAPAFMSGLDMSHVSGQVVSGAGASAEQINHNRSEAGLGGFTSAGGEQIAHNRSEQGLTEP